MTDTNTIELIINNIPLLLEYFIPGYCTILFYRRLKSSKKEKELSDSVQLGTSILISYFLITILDFVGKLPLIPTITTPYARCIAEIFVGAFLSVVVLRLLRCSFIRKYYSKINNTTLSRTVFECCNLDEGPYITVYKEDKKVYGRLVVYNDEEGDEWFAIDSYEIYDANHSLQDHWSKHDKYSRYLIPLCEIKSFEIHYDKSSSIYPKWYDEKRKGVNAADVLSTTQNDSKS